MVLLAILFQEPVTERPGPPPLRSNEFVLGLPSLRASDQTKVSEGNLFVRFSAQLLTIAAGLLLPFTLENPAKQSAVVVSLLFCKLSVENVAQFMPANFVCLAAVGANPPSFWRSIVTSLCLMTIGASGLNVELANVLAVVTFLFLGRLHLVSGLHISHKHILSNCAM